MREWSPQTREKLRAAILIELDRRKRERENRGTLEESFGTFYRASWPHIDPAEYIHGYHIDAVAEHLQAVTRGEIRRLIINMPPRFSKPVAHDALVLTRNKGLIPLSAIIVGDEVWTHRSRWRRVLAVHRQGTIPAVRLRTWSGRSVVAAPDHPFLTPDGWRPVGDLEPEDVVGIVPCRDDCGANTMSLETARLLGYLIGDGHCAGTPDVTVADDIELADIVHCVRSVGFDPRVQTYKMRADKTTYVRRVSLRGGCGGPGRNKKGYLGPVKMWLKSYGLLGQNSYTKEVPAAVLAGTTEIVENFLAAYWACDGYVTSKGTKKDGSKRRDLFIGCDSVNSRLIQQIQMLLTRLGVDSRTRKKVAKIKTKRQGDTYTSYSLGIWTQDDAWRFAQIIKMRHAKQQRIEEVFGRRFDFDRPLWGDSVTAVEPIEDTECLCLEVEEDHSFTANGYAVHNSLMFAVAWPAWTWAQSEVGPLSGPQVKFIFSSYSNRFAKRDGRKTKRLIASPWYQNLWGERVSLKVSPDTDEYFETEAGGFRFATSVGGGITGEGSDVLGVDDPINAKKANWESARLEANEWWDEVMTSRLNDPITGAKIITMQRLHEDDLVGHVLAKELGDQYVQLILPMEMDWKRPATIIGWEDWRETEGELLWPERFPPNVVENMKADLGPFGSSAQLQQSPSPRGGGIIERDWWQAWPPDQTSPEYRGMNIDPDAYPDMALVIGSIDTAYGEKDEDAWNAMTTWGVWYDRRERPKVMLMHAWRKRLPLRGAIPEGLKTAPERRPHWGLVEHIADSVQKLGIDVLLIEDKTRGNDLRAELVRLLRPEDCQIVMIQPHGDKVARLHAVEPMFAANMVWAPDKAWAEMVINEVSQFPKSKYKDLTDTVSQALSYLRRNDLLLLAHEADEETIRRNTFQPQRVSPYDI